MKPIKVVPENHPKIAALLAQVHGKAKQHTATPEQIQSIANLAEAKLVGLGINKAARCGAEAKGRSGAKLPNSYKYSRQVSLFALERRSGAWWLVFVDQIQTWQSAGWWILKLTPRQDELATAVHRSQYVTDVSQAQIRDDLVKACAAALVCIRGVDKFHAEEKMLNSALYAAGMRTVCNQEVTP